MKVCLDKNILTSCVDFPKKDYLDNILAKAGMKSQYWSQKLQNTVYVVNKMPENNGVFGIKWVRVQ